MSTSYSEHVPSAEPRHRQTIPFMSWQESISWSLSEPLLLTNILSSTQICFSQKSYVVDDPKSCQAAKKQNKKKLKRTKLDAITVLATLGRGEECALNREDKNIRRLFVSAFNSQIKPEHRESFNDSGNAEKTERFGQNDILAMSSEVEGCLAGTCLSYNVSEVWGGVQRVMLGTTMETSNRNSVPLQHN